MTGDYFEINGRWYPVELAATGEDWVLNEEIDEGMLKRWCSSRTVINFYASTMDTSGSKWKVWYHFRIGGLVGRSCPHYMNADVFRQIYRFREVLVSQVNWKREGF